MTPEIRKGLINWAVKGFLYKAFVGFVLMLSAGRWTWLAGWFYVVIFLAFDAASALVVIPRDPGLLLERAKPNPGAKSWDKILMPISSGLLPLVSWILAGLNERWSWEPVMRDGFVITGYALTIAGYGLLVWAMSANNFFSPLVRIQEERGHRVADGGPYRIVRHPGYLGAIGFSVGVPLLLGSWWALLPGLIAAALMVLRTSLEDHTLAEELPGYKQYQARVRFKLIPGVW
jgi:protein-S-isoprenylcysteine O-methyltransferase Ste14